ncbi:MAG: helix-hairpin-helix domain-containing protein [Actinobacteria bacterium]|nr:helix-hairpin-helix domain-containing protein [Actinomycetota bacterium]
MEPAGTSDDDPVRTDAGGVPRPLPPPPTLADLAAVFRERLLLRHPRFDATRVVLVVACVAATSGMFWALHTRPSGGGRPANVAVVGSTVPPTSVVATTSSLPATIVVDVAGAVVRPGPVEVPRGARVATVLDAVGGVTGEADLERVDRAATLGDGQRVYVPRRGQSEIPVVVGPAGSGTATASGDPGAAATPPVASAGPININTADEAALDGLPGVGPATARAIVEHRRTKGPFRSVDQLLEVKGIGPAKLADLRPHVTV